ncbi:MAG: hypothetical protein ACSLE6_08840 [Mycobacterium sp.]
MPRPSRTMGRSWPLAASDPTMSGAACMARLVAASIWIPGKWFCNPNNEASMTESPTALIWSPGGGNKGSGGVGCDPSGTGVVSATGGAAAGVGTGV